MNDDEFKNVVTAGSLIAALGLGWLIFGQDATPPPASQVPVATQPAPISEQRKAFTMMNSELTELFAQCDEADAPIDAAMKKSDVYRAYDRAEAAFATCNDTSDKLEKVTVPDIFPEAVRSKLRKSLDDCAAAYTARAQSYDAEKHVLNGDVSPETVEIAKDQKTEANSEAAVCAVGYMRAADAGGFSDIALSEVK
ncbi:MAG TPA: hypothetical protein VHU87_03130 [Rhizomicrobium sp.]|jgi:hypothetical protein|nr:hypothetical protein [Rhizomicrobium sp.]